MEIGKEYDFVEDKGVDCGTGSTGNVSDVLYHFLVDHFFVPYLSLSLKLKIAYECV